MSTSTFSRQEQELSGGSFGAFCKTGYRQAEKGARDCLLTQYIFFILVKRSNIFRNHAHSRTLLLMAAYGKHRKVRLKGVPFLGKSVSETMLNDKVILIASTGESIEKKFVERVLNAYQPRKLILFGRDELDLVNKLEDLDREHYPCLRYFVGDFSDRRRLYRAFEGVDIILLGAIAKRASNASGVIDSVNRNLWGLMNLVDAAIDRGVKKVVYISNSNTYCANSLDNAIWLCSDKLVAASNSYSGQGGTRFSVIRFGSIPRHWDDLISGVGQEMEFNDSGTPDLSATLFWLTVDQSVEFILFCLGRMFGGEIFIPKSPSVRSNELSEYFSPVKLQQLIGPETCGELHEVLLSEEESIFTLEYETFFTILPFFIEKSRYVFMGPSEGVPLPLNYSYESENNASWLSKDEIKQFLKFGNEKSRS